MLYAKCLPCFFLITWTSQKVHMNMMTINWHVALRPMETEDASGRSASVKFYQRIYVSNCPTRCNNIRFIYVCKLLYMFWVVTPLIIRSSCQCNCIIWHYWDRTSACLEYDWMGTISIQACSQDSYWHIFHDARTPKHKIYQRSSFIYVPCIACCEISWFWLFRSCGMWCLIVW
jgi:hypothetical protein